MKEKPTILVTNDDGYRAKGFHKLINLMCRIGKVVAVSTERPMSAQSHSITMAEPLRYKLVQQGDGMELYVSNGRPADCVKMGYQLIMDGLPDVVVSGINHGSNASVNVIYSGTMAAVIEACMDNIPAIGFSLNNYSSDAYFDHLDNFIIDITKKTLEKGLPKGVCLNVNFPEYNENEAIKGVMVCSHAKGHWVEDFDRRKDPYGHEYFWLTGYFDDSEVEEGTDIYAVRNNYASVVPTHFDWTDYESINLLKKWDL